MSHLRRYLERTRALPPEQLDAALRRQQIYGGSLDTVLLELEIIDPVTLGELLKLACGLQLVDPDLVDEQQDRPWHLVPEDLVEIGWAVPLGERGGEVLVGVHPDLPNERLGALHRAIRIVRPMVLPECCLEKIAAERTTSVVPQRYAVLCVAWLSALRRRPSVSGIVLIPPDMVDRTATTSGSPRQPVADEDSRPSDHEPARLQQDVDPEFDQRPTMIYEREEGMLPSPARRATALAPPPPAGPAVERVAVGSAGASPSFRPPPLPTAPMRARAEDAAAVPHYVPPSSSAQDAPQPIVLGPTEAIVSGAPPIRFTARGTTIPEPAALQGVPSREELESRMAGARELLGTTDTRDGAIDALAQAVSVVTPRLALFRLRGHELVGLSLPRSSLPDPGGKVLVLDPERDLGQAFMVGRWAGTCDDEELRLALGIGDPIPCYMRRIDVGGRPTLMLYADHGRREFLPYEVALLDLLCADAGRSFERIVVRRRADQPRDLPPVRFDASQLGIGPPPEFAGQDGGWRPPPTLRPTDPVGDAPLPALVTTPRRPTMVDGSPPRAPLASELVDRGRPTDLYREGPTPPPRPSDRTTEEPSPSARVAQEPRPREPARTEAIPPQESEAALARNTEPYGSEGSGSGNGAPVLSVGDDDDDDQPRQMLTIHAMPPPPPIPPPPPMGLEDADTRPKMDTLTGLGPALSDAMSGPLFVPPPLEGEGFGIMSLAAPITEPSARGRIEIDDEEWTQSGSHVATESTQRRIDAALRSIAAGNAEIGELREFGDAALVRLSSQFPGPLEILRRDLRALPPPSAHGPLVRTAIRVGAEMVPHLLDLFDHPSPDVRFYAAFVFQELRDDRCMRPLSELAFDQSGDVRVIAMRVLETYHRSPGFLASASGVRAQLDSANRTRQLYAGRAVGTLRDVQSVAKLIELLSSRDRFVQEAALESLCSITGQQHGLKPHRWKEWFEQSSQRHRIEWIIDSLRHKELPVRRWASDELVRVTGHRVPYSPMGDKEARDMAVEAWTEWWHSRGRSLLGG